MSVAERIREHASALRPAERRVGQAVLDDIESVAFSTVAEVARRAGTSGATVVRFSRQVGYEGFVGLQAAVQRELTGRIRPAGERIRSPRSTEPISRTLEVELDNVRRSITGVVPDHLHTAVRAIASRRGRVGVLPGGASHGVARQLADELSMLRPGVELIWGPALSVLATLASYGAGDSVLAIDLPRYDRTLVQAVERAASSSVSVVAVTDSALSPIGRIASATFAVASEGAGPFDSHLGVLSVANLLVTCVADALRRSAVERIDEIESAWNVAGALLDG